MNLRELKEIIRSGDLDKVRGAVDDKPDLSHTHDPNDDKWEVS